MENLTNKKKKTGNNKKEPDTLKKSEVVSNDDKKSKITAPCGSQGQRTTQPARPSSPQRQAQAFHERRYS